jgi:hypothetical protein
MLLFCSRLFYRLCRHTFFLCFFALYELRICFAGASVVHISTVSNRHFESIPCKHTYRKVSLCACPFIIQNRNAHLGGHSQLPLDITKPKCYVSKKASKKIRSLF